VSMMVLTGTAAWPGAGGRHHDTRPRWPRSCRQSCGSRRWRAAAARATPRRRAPCPRAPPRPAAPRSTCFDLPGRRLGPDCVPMCRADQYDNSSNMPWCICLGQHELLSQDLRSIIDCDNPSIIMYQMRCSALQQSYMVQLARPTGPPTCWKRSRTKAPTLPDAPAAAPAPLLASASPGRTWCARRCPLSRALPLLAQAAQSVGPHRSSLLSLHAGTLRKFFRSQNGLCLSPSAVSRTLVAHKIPRH